MVLHVNHRQELNNELHLVLAALRITGTTLFNQAVLLQGINDQAQIQIELCHALFRQGVMPYYLHVLDPVDGAAHFDVSDDDARQIWEAMQSQLPGYLLPRLVREVPDEDHKRWLNRS
jgi:L-lysine 2,3-aminomutase